MQAFADSTPAGTATLPWSMVWAAALMSIRVATALVLTPVLQLISMPTTARIVLVVGLSATLVAALTPAAAVPVSFETMDMIRAGLNEACLGLLLGWGVASAYAAVELAASMLDVQLGFGLAQVLDPLTRRRIPVLTASFHLIAGVVFVLADGHHAVLRALALSVERFPLGAPWSLQMPALQLIHQMAGLYSLGLALAAPVMVAVLLTDLALMVLMRNLPQMNMFVIGTPIKIIVGLIGLSLWASAMGGALGRIHAMVFNTWAALFAGR